MRKQKSACGSRAAAKIKKNDKETVTLKKHAYSKQKSACGVRAVSNQKKTKIFDPETVPLFIKSISIKLKLYCRK